MEGFFDDKITLVIAFLVGFLVGMGFGAAVIYAAVYGFPPTKSGRAPNSVVSGTIPETPVSYLRQTLARPNACSDTWWDDADYTTGGR
jgi:hypothetical protein